MSQSLYTSMSGITAASTSLEVISNDIANINTTAYKSKSVQFADVFYQTLSSGSVATASTGGTNPVQVGVGTQVSSINTNYSTGSWEATGIDTNLMIGGAGFFAVKGSDNSTYYTRDGDFSFDSNGNLVTSDGYKVYGTSTIYGSKTSGSTVKVPLTICPDVKGTDSTTLAKETLSQLNGLSKNITSGDFTSTITINGTQYTATVTGLENISDTTSTVANLQSHLTSGDSTTTPPLTGVNTTYKDAAGNSVVISGITTSLSNGKVVMDTSGAKIDGASATVTAMTFGTTGLTNATNFVTATGLTYNATTKTASTNTLDYTATIAELTSAAQSTSKKSETISSDGSIQVTYDDGSTLSVQLASDGENYEFVYKTSDNVSISGSKCAVSSDVATTSNFVIQMATITNTNGLLSAGNNLFKEGPNCGEIVYTVAGQMGSGNLESGGLEASNVDMSTELSNMILAQRAIEANSRVFSTTSDVLQTIVNMGK